MREREREREIPRQYILYYAYAYTWEHSWWNAPSSCGAGKHGSYFFFLLVAARTPHAEL